ncbi:MAG: ASPIC/UnbV domain protein [Myxococcales bacterium]|nr:ASPIC/UnbV domain protein [Myxococcales bacterium]
MLGRRCRWLLAAASLAACSDPAEAPGPTCLDPPQGPLMSWFRDVTHESGVAFEYTSNDFKGGGLAVVDLDGDGRPDLVAGRRTGGLSLYRNRGSLRFTRVAASGLDPETAVRAIAAVDLDNDGDRDLVLAGTGHADVMGNQGDGTFRPVARLEGSGLTEHVLPVDLDGDGLLDLYVSNADIFDAEASTNRVYLQRGPLDFRLAASIGRGLSWSTTAFDVDADGDQDLYVANDTLRVDHGKPTMPGASSLPPDLLLRNDGVGSDGVPRFTDIAEERGFATPRSSMGGLLADFDDDGRLDLYVPDFGANELFLRDPTGGFVERATELGVAASARRNALCGPDPTTEDCLVLTWSAALSDFDLDGHDELLLVNGETSPLDAPPVLMFTRGPELSYREVSPGIPCADARGLVVTDLDGDGDQDIVIASKEGPLMIYENRGVPVPGTWLQVRLRGRASNRDGVGAVVSVHLATGRVLTKVVGAGGVVHTASPAEAWFGLGSDRVVTIEVHWPSGHRTELSHPQESSVKMDEAP